MTRHLCIVARDNSPLYGFLTIAFRERPAGADTLDVVLDRRRADTVPVSSDPARRPHADRRRHARVADALRTARLCHRRRSGRHAQRDRRGIHRARGGHPRRRGAPRAPGPPIPPAAAGRGPSPRPRRHRRGDRARHRLGAGDAPQDRRACARHRRSGSLDRCRRGSARAGAGRRSAVGPAPSRPSASRRRTAPACPSRRDRWRRPLRRPHPLSHRRRKPSARSRPCLRPCRAGLRAGGAPGASNRPARSERRAGSLPPRGPHPGPRRWNRPAPRPATPSARETLSREAGLREPASRESSDPGDTRSSRPLQRTPAGGAFPPAIELRQWHRLHRAPGRYAEAARCRAPRSGCGASREMGRRARRGSTRWIRPEPTAAARCRRTPCRPSSACGCSSAICASRCRSIPEAPEARPRASRWTGYLEKWSRASGGRTSSPLKSTVAITSTLAPPPSPWQPMAARVGLPRSP